MSYGGYGHSNNSGGSWVTIIVGIILLLFLTSATKSCSRSESHMIYLSEGYCYHEDTHIIYIESEVGRYGDRTSYAIYYDENGKVNKYDPETGEWIPVDQ